MLSAASAKPKFDSGIEEEDHDADLIDSLKCHDYDKSNCPGVRAFELDHVAVPVPTVMATRCECIRHLFV